MNSNYSSTIFFLAAFMILSPLRIVMADDYMEARHLLESGEIMPLEDILKNVRKIYTGNVIEVELEKEDQQIVYEIEILGPDGVIREIYINAKTGKLLLKDDDD